MISLTEYAKIKNKYCIAYFGHSKEYIIQLRLLRPLMEKKFPDIEIYLSSKDDMTYLFRNEPRTLSKTDLLENKKQFAYINEISYNGKNHPIEKFMEDSEIKIEPIVSEVSNFGNAVLFSQGSYPNKKLCYNKIKSIINYVESRNCKVDINQPFENYSWVIGIENEQVYEAAALGKKITLIPTGIGENLFKMMFPCTEILNIY